MHVPKYGYHNLASSLLSFWSFWTAFISCCPLSWRYFCFRCVVVDPCFIHCHIQYSSKQRSGSSKRCCFWSSVWKRGIHFENNLRIPKDSCKIVSKLPSDIFKMSAISLNFNLRSPKIILWTFVMFSGKTVDFGRPERLASSVFVRPRLNSANQSMIIDFPGAESP